MDNPSSQSSTKNKNLSIKEFFTTRLMRARSFEGGANSPKDENTNWFDEFKARMIKKPQGSSSKQATSAATGDNESNDSSDIGVRFAPHLKLKVRYNKDDQIASLVKDSCDNFLTTLQSSSGEDLSNSRDDCLQPPEQTPNLGYKKSGLKSRVSQRVSNESLDFDSASINTIFNRRDSRYNTVPHKPKKLFSSWIFSPLKKLISYMLPFNYNLPWKILSLISITFVIIVMALTSETHPNITAFRFFNGFVCGLLVALVSVAIVLSSLFVQILPKSQEIEKDANTFNHSRRSDSNLLESTRINHEDTTVDSTEKKADDFSSFEILDIRNNVDDSNARNEFLLDDDNYKGWMIEFIGDYELRNKSDIKLKLIFVRIESRILYLCKPKNSHDAESAAFPVFVQKRLYDLNVAPKFSATLLLPKNVRNRQKWIWSKKYPIRLEFQEDLDKSSSSPENSKNIQLTLFAKSCREKEEWFRRFKKIVEDNKMASGCANKRPSLNSECSANCEGISDSRKSLFNRTASPFSRCDGVQTSRSSHILSDSKKIYSENKLPESQTNLIRTKSCELIHADEALSNDASYQDDSTCRFGDSMPDDSTLTRETAETYSQAVEYSNFVESRPTLDYREYIERVIESGQDATSTSDWFNALIGRIFFDVFSHNYWSYWFKRKIQRKLYRIRLPYFIETLTLTKIDLGSNAPQFNNVISHTFDSFGLSIDFDMAYSGGLTLTFETKLNLLKIKSDNATPASAQPTSNLNSSGGIQNPVTIQPLDSTSRDGNSTSESSLDGLCNEHSKPLSSPGSTKTSGESSDSEESDSSSSSDSSMEEDGEDEISDWEDYDAEKTRQSIVRFVDKIASSRYFQHATENRYIKKKLQDISNCPLVLIVKIQSLNGVLSVNVPPPQTDRIWYGFKPNPELILKALPKMGDREVNLSHVTDWIEKKLAEEFRKILVIPNMEDIVLPVLRSDHLLYVTSTK